MRGCGKMNLVLAAPFAVALAAGILAPASPARAERVPSADLSFRVLVQPDSITVGDPISVTLDAAGPAGAALELPQLADSVGPFSVLSADPVVTSSKEGRVFARQSGKVTLFKTGEQTFPELALLWVRAPGETLVAWSQPQKVRVRSLLKPGDADLSKLRGLKGPVPLGRPLWWLWGLIAAAAAALAFLAWKHRERLRRRVVSVAAPAPPPLPPDTAFERGLAALYDKQLPERGFIKEFYAEVSLLFRRYLEDRFGFPAVEETRTEVLTKAEAHPELVREDLGSLRDWLDEGDLVKFARMERLLAEAREHAEGARAFVRRTAAPRVLPMVGEAPSPFTPPSPGSILPGGMNAGPAAPGVNAPSPSVVSGGEPETAAASTEEAP